MPPDSKRPFFNRSSLLWIAIGFPVAVLVALGCMWYVGLSSLQSQLAALRAKGLPTTASEVNAFYVVPQGVADTTDLWVAAIDAVQAANLDRRGKTLPIVGEGPTPVPAPGEEWTELEASRTLLGELDGELQAIRKATESGGRVRFPVDFSAGIFTLLPHAQSSRDVARLLELDAHVSAHDGNDSQALQDLRATFALSDALRGEPTLISQLVRIAIHAIGCDAAERLMPHCNWSDAELESLQTAIRSARFKDELSNALCGERAICLTTLDRLPLGLLPPSNKHEALRFFESSIDGLSSSWPDALSRQRELSTRMEALSGNRFIPLILASVLLLLPGVEQAAIAGARAEARQKCANAAIAAQRFRLQRGQLPDSLANIGQELLGSLSEPSAALIDPFDGQPLRYKTEPARVLIYSIGENKQDDGGDCDRDDQQRPLDVGFSVKK